MQRDDYARQRVVETCAAQGIPVSPGPEVLDVVAAMLAQPARKVERDVRAA